MGRPKLSKNKKPGKTKKYASLGKPVTKKTSSKKAVKAVRKPRQDWKVTPEIDFNAEFSAVRQLVLHTYNDIMNVFRTGLLSAFKHYYAAKCIDAHATGKDVPNLAVVLESFLYTNLDSASVMNLTRAEFKSAIENMCPDFTQLVCQQSDVAIQAEVNHCPDEHRAPDSPCEPGEDSHTMEKQEAVVSNGLNLL